MKADRLLSIIALLQQNKQMRAKDLSDQLEVSIRTIYRDIDALTYMGVPIVMNRGYEGGIKLLGDYQSDLTGLKDEELKYLFLPHPTKILKDLDIENFSHASLLKFVGKTSKHQMTLIEKIKNYIYVDMDGWHQNHPIDKNILNQLQQAIWNTQKIKIEYHKGAECKPIYLCPLGLVNKKGTWYLVAIDNLVKTYKVSSISKVTMTEDTFERPHDFHLETYWKLSIQSFMKKIPHYDLVIETTKEVATQIENRKFISVIHKEVTDSFTTLTLRFNAKWQAVEFAFSYGNQIKIIHPYEVKEKIIELAKAILRHYD